MYHTKQNRIITVHHCRPFNRLMPDLSIYMYRIMWHCIAAALEDLFVAPELLSVSYHLEFASLQPLYRLLFH